MGFEVVYKGVEGLSGKDTDRPELQAILGLINKKAIQHLLTIKLDRLSRDASDALAIGKKATKKGERIHLVTEGGAVNLVDPAAELMFLMRSGFAQFERRMATSNQLSPEYWSFEN
jgi:site-specific DNA recombinase